MSHKAIVLWDPKVHAKLASDDACTTILQYELPRAPSTIRPPYQSPHASDVKLRYVPPLSYFCIKALAEYPDEMHALGSARLLYQAPWSPDHFDILSALIPTYRPLDEDNDSFDLSLVDPRLWAVLIQAYEGLPDAFRRYTLPLSDAHLPLLQTIPSTKHFCLITTLSLSRCPMLTDDTVLELRHLHTLAALDVSVTALGTWGIRRLVSSLAWSEGEEAARRAERRGPWGLRILDLRNCINIDDKVLSWIKRFPLLSVVDLRGTVCRPWRQPDFPFTASANTGLYHPTPLTEALDHLAERKAGLFSHPKPFVLKVDKIHHDATPTHSGSHRVNKLYDANDDGYRPKWQSIGRRTDVFRPQVPPERHDHTDDWDNSMLPNGTNTDEDHSDDSCGDSGDKAVHDNDEEHEHPSGSSSPTDPASGNEQLWMNDVAEDEGHSYTHQREAVKFYARPLVPSIRRASSGPANVSAIGPNSPPNHKEAAQADPLMLFRPPPPWSALPTSPPAKKPVSSFAPSMPESVFAARPSDSSHTLKRKRSELEEMAPAPADQARRRMHALSSIQSLFSMVQKRETRPGGEKSGASSSVRMVVPGRVNPFARTAQGVKKKQKRAEPLATTEERCAESSSTRKTSAAPAEAARDVGIARPSRPATTVPKRPMPQGSTKPSPHPQKALAPAKPPAPPGPDKRPPPPAPAQATTERPAKKLKPITTLTVPEWPHAHHKPASHYRPKLPAAPPPSKARVQTTLPVSVSKGSDKGKGPEKEKERRRVSAPVMVTSPLEMVAVGKSEQVKETAARSGKAPSSSKGGPKAKTKSTRGFNWKSWGAG
ncbi:hypothetical protein C8Q77DRAFT_541098 [Trametes polyzona]|nr:hypothetical protein C8Q77DRAFT_541098 [Trametes polyzona]